MWKEVEKCLRAIQEKHTLSGTSEAPTHQERTEEDYCREKAVFPQQQLHSEDSVRTVWGQCEELKVISLDHCPHTWWSWTVATPCCDVLICDCLLGCLSKKNMKRKAMHCYDFRHTHTHTYRSGANVFVVWVSCQHSLLCCVGFIGVVVLYLITHFLQ